MNKDLYVKELETIKMNSVVKEEIKNHLYQGSLTGFKKRWNFRIISLCILSVCILLTFSLTYLRQTQQNTPGSDPIPTPQPEPDPQPEPNDNRFVIDGSDDGGFGMEGYMVKNVSELKRNNPYLLTYPSEKMPVYKNTNQRDSAGNVIDPMSQTEKDLLLKDYAKRLGIKTYNIVQGDYNHELVSDICTISYEGFSIHIQFSEEYLRSHKIDMKADNTIEAEKKTEKLYQTYQKLFDIDQPLYQVFGDYNIYGKRTWYYTISQKTNDQNQSLLNSLTRQVVFCPDENDQFASMIIYRYDLSEKMGDYSIVSLSQAKQRLNDGRFLTSIYPIDVSEIGYVEMTYRINEFAEYYLPYYKFYVYYEDKEYEQKGLKTYVACYVSALQDEFIKEDYDRITFN